MGSNYAFAANGRVDFFQYDPTQYSPYGNTSGGGGYDGSGINPYTNGTMDAYNDPYATSTPNGYYNDGIATPTWSGQYAKGNVWNDAYDPFAGYGALPMGAIGSPPLQDPYAQINAYSPYGSYTAPYGGGYGLPLYGGAYNYPIASHPAASLPWGIPATQRAPLRRLIAP